jgi:hypothetical protein
MSRGPSVKVSYELLGRICESLKAVVETKIRRKRSPKPEAIWAKEKYCLHFLEAGFQRFNLWDLILKNEEDPLTSIFREDWGIGSGRGCDLTYNLKPIGVHFC